jgi:D-aminoacyl-tRNA deacylase
MRALIQRVKNSSVKVDGKVVGEIEKGILVLLGVSKEDERKDADFLAKKILGLRVFASENKPMDLSVEDVKGALLVVSQFTLYGSTKKGRRPDFGDAALPEKATELYEYFVEKCKESGLKVETGEFGAMMDVSLVNDGPVTFMIES